MMRCLTLALVATLAVSTTAAEDPAPAWVDEARSGAGALGSQLQQALRSAMQEGGPVAGIEVCKLQAPGIAEAVSGSRLHVGRTSTKVRNPDNAPGSWESLVMQDFQRRLEAGESPAQLETFAIRADGNRRYGHWMKAIPTQGLCTACHGTDISPDVAKAIGEAYPDDQARGFSVGELRGAFSVEVDLEAD